MKIIEARDGFINFEADESVYLSSFIQAAGMDKTYIAQVNQMKKFGKIVIASARILFIYDGEKLIDYDRTLPSRDSDIDIFPLNIIQNSIRAKNPVIIGKTLDDSMNIFMDLSAFNKKTLISVDSNEMNNILVQNLSKQFEHFGQKTIVIDTLGAIKGERYVAGRDFKLPLDTPTLDFMYKLCLNDATDDSKSIIAEVFKDLAEYSETVPFVPFGVLKSIVDDMVDKQHIFRLFVLKNRLANFEQLKYFATEQKEVENIEKILSSNVAIIDLSKLSSLFQNRFIEYIYTKLDTKNTQVLFEVSNTVSKKNLKTMIVDSNVSTTLITHSKFQYLSDIKDMLKNFIIEQTVTNGELFRIYCTFLSSMQEGMYLTAGEDINYIPMVSKVQVIEDTLDALENDEEYSTAIEDEPFEEVAAEIIEEEDNTNLQTEEFVEPQAEEDVPTQEEIIAEIEEKSNDAIEAISENIDETTEFDLFGDDDSSEEHDEEIIDEEIKEPVDKDATNVPEEAQEEQEELLEGDLEEFVEESNDVKEEETVLSGDFIEPEYSELSESDESVSVDALDLTEQEPMEVSNDVDNIPELDADEIGDVIEADSLTDSELEEQFADSEAEVEDILLEEDSEDTLEGFAEAEENAPELNNTEEELADNEILLQDFGEDNSDELPDEDDVSIELSDEEKLLLEETDSVEEPQESEPIKISEDFSEPSIMPIDGNEYNQEHEENIEYGDEDIKEDDIIIDMEDDDIGIDEDVDRQIVEDVDKVFTTMRTGEDTEEISDSDLDLIDALNSDEDELEEYNGELEEVSDAQIEDGILEQPSESIIPPRQPHAENNEILEKKEVNTPIVPVYDADIPQEDMVVSDEIQQGDSVVHTKYGNGVVEKMIKYGTKTLFSINFENIGRRLLDPTLTEIKKL